MSGGRKKFPVGIENFEDIRKEKFYYVDKTGLIRDLLSDWSKVNLFTRPRRFGKSLNMSMLKYFFEIGCDQTLFDGLEIAGETELCETYMGKFPVISISLKGVNGGDFETARALMCSVIGDEAMRFETLLMESDKLTETEKERYGQLVTVDCEGKSVYAMSDAALMGSLKTLSTLLQKHYGQKVILLIDEYDVPLAKASEMQYYDEMVILIRNMFEQALKTNDSLYFAVLTGCLRVARESIFTGLNNLNVLSVLDVEFDEYFGFTDAEVKALLEYYDLTEVYGLVKEWYDGYRFGNADVYCPWDVICYCKKRRANKRLQPEDYWTNTSGNDVIKRFLKKAKPATKREIEALIAGKSVVKEIHQELTYKNLYQSIDNIWSVLFTTGYLTRQGEPEGKKLQLVIPNKEIRNLFIDQISEWFQEETRQDGMALDAFCDAFGRGDAEEVERRFQSYLTQTISIRDTAVANDRKENFYHGILLGLLGYKDSWDVFSNRESGNGYSDIMVEVPDERIGIVIELKYADQGKLDEACQNALDQIEEKGYAAELLEDGMETILKYGIACCRKQCRVRVY